MIPDEHFDTIAWPDVVDLGSDERRSAVEASLASLYLCGNCGRLYREDASGHTFAYIANAAPPRVWADFTDLDSLGRVLLRGDRSLADIRRQKLIFNPPLDVLLYDDSGAECPGEANFGLSASSDSESSDVYDMTLWAVTLQK
ncbi:hypothetical protein G3I60_08955 [Streptomyces sp. SID13666]|uniref:hypothetical protein n=1 Tax=unclassified Streptomyces TaxID=2593676 RepID=UPI0013C09FC6|nr:MULTISPECIES: hypothetical protein [unclassified Streptomyces]NEA54276.1 hypothetical protein [Streptomyces sp. SID13666]NEA70371.1 hypothetical protein [Streptomyces sp. SID13588]